MHEFSSHSTSPPPQLHNLNAVYGESALIGPAGAYDMSATYELRQDVGVHNARCVCQQRYDNLYVTTDRQNEKSMLLATTSRLDDFP
jgi:hypothetical protein